MIRKLYFDVETTGLSSERCAIHQIAMIFEIDGQVQEKINWRVKPFKGAEFQEKAMEMADATEAEMALFTPEREVYVDLINRLETYVSKYNRFEKFHLVGYNNRNFDDQFLRAMFERCKDSYFGSWFWSDSIDVMVLASNYLAEERPYMTNFKLGTVAKQVGIEVSEEGLHDAFYDVELTKKIADIISLM